MSVYKQRLIDEAKEIANKYMLSKERTNLLGSPLEVVHHLR